MPIAARCNILTVAQPLHEQAVREPYGICAGHAETLPITWIMQKCWLSQVAPTQRPARPGRPQSAARTRYDFPMSWLMDAVTARCGFELAEDKRLVECPPPRLLGTDPRDTARGGDTHSLHFVIDGS